MDEQMPEVMKRVEKLECENRSLRRGMRSLWILIGILGAMVGFAAAKEAPEQRSQKFENLTVDSLATRRISVVDDSGQVRGTWGMEPGADAVGMQMFSKGGAKILSSYVTDAGEALWKIVGPDESGRVSVVADKDGAMVEMGPVGKASLRLEIAKSERHQGVAGITLESPVGEAHMRVQGTGSPTVSVTQGAMSVSMLAEGERGAFSAIEANQNFADLSVRSQKASMMIRDANGTRKLNTDTQYPAKE